MTTINSSLRRDSNRVPLQDVNGITIIKRFTFDSTAAEAQSLFTVTGDVIIRVFGICKTNVASAAAANLIVGTATTTNRFLASTVASALLANEIWHDNSPDATSELDSVSPSYIISNGQDVILTPSAVVDSGVIDFYCQWRPLSSDADVVAA